MSRLYLYLLRRYQQQPQQKYVDLNDKMKKLNHCDQFFFLSQSINQVNPNINNEKIYKTNCFFLV